MRVLTLARSYLEHKTVGILSGKGVEFKTLERPWLNNTPNSSCIPEGCYIVKRDKAGRFQYYAVQEVPNRSAIEFHAGNFVEHSQGCILVGEGLNREQDLVNSNNAINKMVEIIGDNDFILNIRAANKDDFS